MINIDNIRQTRLEINLDRLESNLKKIRNFTQDGVKILAVIKSDAYSHGSLQVAQTLMDSGADALAVASLNEALELRKNNFTYPIIIFGYTQESEYEKLIKYNIIQTVYSYDQAKKLSSIAKKMKKHINIHLKIDTGMNRLGFKPNDESLEKIKAIYKLENLTIRGIYSHFAESEIEDKSFTHKQFKSFSSFLNILKDNNINIPIKHISNAAAAIELPQYNLDMVRLGISIFGLYPNFNLEKNLIDLKLTLSFKTHISHIKKVPKGESISYNRTFICNKDMIVATLPVGYADGYFQELAEKIGVHINGVRAEVLGKVCMDQTMIDVSHIQDLKVGDEVELFCDQVQHLLKARDLATIGRRVPKVYFKSGKPIKSVDYLLDC